MLLSYSEILGTDSEHGWLAHGVKVVEKVMETFTGPNEIQTFSPAKGLLGLEEILVEELKM